jgi:hypothetical protein
MKICVVGIDLLRADEQTDRQTLVVAFRNFAKEHKNVYVIDCMDNPFMLLWKLRFIMGHF